MEKELIIKKVGPEITTEFIRIPSGILSPKDSSNEDAADVNFLDRVKNTFMFIANNKFRVIQPDDGFDAIFSFSFED